MRKIHPQFRLCVRGAAISAHPTGAPRDRSPPDDFPTRRLLRTTTVPRATTAHHDRPPSGPATVGKGKLCSCGARKPDKKFWGRNVDLGLVSSCFARANQTQVNICSPQNFLQTMIPFTIKTYFVREYFGYVMQPSPTKDLGTKYL